MLQAALLGQGSSTGALLNSKYLELLVAAILGFLFALLLEFLKRRAGPRDSLVWSLDRESTSFDVDRDVRDNLEVRYRDRPVGDLTWARFSVHNTGNTLVRDLELRFALPEGAVLHDLGPKSTPAPEAGVVELDPAISGIADTRSATCRNARGSIL